MVLKKIFYSLILLGENMLYKNKSTFFNGKIKIVIYFYFKMACMKKASNFLRYT